MKIALLGAGNVGGNLVKKLAVSGNHKIIIGTRNTENEKIQNLLSLKNVSAANHLEAIKNSEIVIIAMHPPHIKELFPTFGDVLKDKIIIDCSNQVFEVVNPEFNSATKAIIAISGAEKIVKAFNTTGAENILNTKNGSIDTFIAGEETAKKIATELAIEIGFNPINTGGIDNTHALEEMARIWIAVCRPTGKFNAYFKIHGLE